MKKLLHLAAVPFLAVVITGGMASAATMTTVQETGPNSDQRVNVTKDNDVDLTNNNNTTAGVRNSQRAESGDATVRHNTNGEDARTGSADTDFTVKANVKHANASSNTYALNGDDCACDDDGVTTNIRNTGPRSDVRVNVVDKNEVDVVNNNNTTFDISNTQTTTSGDAKVAGNTNGGDATTGDVTSEATVDLVVADHN